MTLNVFQARLRDVNHVFSKRVIKHYLEPFVNDFLLISSSIEGFSRVIRKELKRSLPTKDARHIILWPKDMTNIQVKGQVKLQRYVEYWKYLCASTVTVV